MQCYSKLQSDATLSVGVAGIAEGRYKYTLDLLALEAVHSASSWKPVSGAFPVVAHWEPYLACHPDQQFAAFLRRGLSFGFRIGYNRRQSLHSSSGNLSSAIANPAAVERYLAEEVEAGKLKQVAAQRLTHVSPIGLIPKSHQPGRFRMIVDLSAPEGHSVNDGIEAALCSLQYASVEQAAHMVKQQGRGALLAKMDLKAAYRMVPVHPEDQYLLGVEWQGVRYHDQALSFGLRSAPKVFTAVADGLAWALACQGARNFLHYLDDYFFCSPAQSSACGATLSMATQLCEHLGFPVSPSKVEGPCTCLTFLGIEIDSVEQVLRLPREKLARLQSLLQVWSRRRAASKHELQVLLGHLNHAAAVVRPGRSFLRELISAMKRLRRADHIVRLSLACRADIAWWAMFIEEWNGVSFIPPNMPSITVVADASGSWGCGAFCQQTGEWLQLRWPQAWQEHGIAAKELVPLVMGAVLWGGSWSGSVIRFLSDNMAVVASLSSRSAREPILSHLLRCLFFFEAHFGFSHVAEHIPGKHNEAADALSRNRVDNFLSIFPQAQPTSVIIPQPVQELLLDTTLSWTSTRWTELFKCILDRD